MSVTGLVRVCQADKTEEKHSRGNSMCKISRQESQRGLCNLVTFFTLDVLGTPTTVMEKRTSTTLRSSSTQTPWQMD